MSSNNEAQRAKRKKPEQEADLVVQYHKIGIKAVAAATRDKAKESGGASGDQERRKPAKARGAK